LSRVNARFNETYTKAEIIGICERNGWKSKHKRHTYTREQLDFLRDNRAQLNQQQLKNAFNEKFGTNLSVDAVVRKCILSGWYSEKKGGSIPRR